MATTYVRLDQIRKAFTFTDTLTSSQISTIETDAVDEEDFLGGILSQFNQVIGATNWWDPIQASAGEPRNLKTLTDGLWYKDMLRWRVKTQDIAVPAAVAASGTLTGSVNFADTETVTIDTTVYTFTSPFVDAAFNVAVGVDLATSLANLKAAINLEAGAGTLYGTATTIHPTCNATASDSTTIDVEANDTGTPGNSIATTDTAANASWGGSTLSGGAGDAVVLVAASSETPAETAAVDAGSANGAVVKVLTGDVGNASLLQVDGLNYLQPKNGCLVRDADTFDPILSDGRIIMALLQAESGVVDGDTFNDSDKQAQLTFVRSNAGGTALELCPAADIAGKNINYSYGSRTELNLANEQDFQFFAWSDPTSTASINLQQAYIGGNTIDVSTSEGTLTFNLSVDTSVFAIQRGGAAFATFTRNDSTGDELQLDLDTFDVNNANDADFLNGAKFDTGGTTINVGVTAGQVDATAIKVAATTGDAWISAADDILFTTVRETTGGGLPLDDATAGAISALPGGPYTSVSAAIRAALTSSQLDIYTQTLANSYAQDANVPGATETWTPVLDLSARTISMLSGSTPDTILFLNGVLLRGGDGTTNNDVYKGTTPANGDLKYDFNKGVKTGDMVTAMSWKAG